MKKLVNVLCLALLVTACSKTELGNDACTVSDVGIGTMISCPDGSTSLVKNGVDGAGLAFSIVPAALDCSGAGSIIVISRDLNNNGVLDTTELPDAQSTTVCNGESSATTDYTPVDILDPCGDAPGIYDEVFLRLSNGMLLWSLSDHMNGTNTRLSLSVPGSWETTDGSHCHFSVDSDYNLFNEHY